MRGGGRNDLIRRGNLEGDGASHAGADWYSVLLHGEMGSTGANGTWFP